MKRAVVIKGLGTLPSINTTRIGLSTAILVLSGVVSCLPASADLYTMEFEGTLQAEHETFYDGPGGSGVIAEPLPGWEAANGAWATGTILMDIDIVGEDANGWIWEGTTQSYTVYVHELDVSVPVEMADFGFDPGDVYFWQSKTDPNDIAPRLQPNSPGTVPYATGYVFNADGDYIVHSTDYAGDGSGHCHMGLFLNHDILDESNLPEGFTEIPPGYSGWVRDIYAIEGGPPVSFQEVPAPVPEPSSLGLFGLGLAGLLLRRGRKR